MPQSLMVTGCTGRSLIVFCCSICRSVSVPSITCLYNNKQCNIEFLTIIVVERTQAVAIVAHIFVIAVLLTCWVVMINDRVNLLTQKPRIWCPSKVKVAAWCRTENRWHGDLCLPFQQCPAGCALLRNPHLKFKRHWT